MSGSRIKQVLQGNVALETELNQERAGALGASGRHLEAQLAECAALATQLKTATGEVRVALLEAHRQARLKAAELRWELCVQREAVGVKRHDDVDRWYPLPAPILE